MLIYRGLAAVALAIAISGSSAADPIPADAYARAPAVSGVSMSAEGDFLVGIIADPRNKDAKALASWDLSNLNPDKPDLPMRVTPSDGRMTFVQAQALKAGKAIAVTNQPGTFALGGCGEGRTTGSTKTWVYKFWLTDRTVEKLDDLGGKGKTVGVSDETLRCLELASTPGFRDLPLDPEHVISIRTDPVTFITSYSKLNLKTGRSTFLYRDSGELGIGLIDPRTAEVRTRSKLEPKGGLKYDFETYILNPQTGGFDVEAPLTVDADMRHTMNVLGYDEQTKKYFVATDKFSDKAAIYLYDAAADKFDDEVLFAHPDFDATSVILGRDPSDFGRILGFGYAGAAGGEVYWVDPDLASIQAGLEKAYPGQFVSLNQWTADRNRILFVTSGPRNPPTYALLVNKAKVVPIGNERPWMDPKDMGDRTLVYYDARDGLKIPAFLTLPAGWKKGDKPPPAIVVPHGGPWARDSADWDGIGWTQYYASRGYAVLQPQYRGSEGWGHKLWTAGDAQWGLRMQDDKDDGANWLVSQGYADKDKLVIHGYSYGGFAAFAAAVRPGGPFKCAIAGAGVANLERIGNNWSENRFQRAYQGVTVTGMDPQKNTDKLAMPILIYHGEYDVRVPLFHATDFYNSVKGTGKAKIVKLDKMGHQGDKWTPDNIRDHYKAMDDFLKNDCGIQ